MSPEVAEFAERKVIQEGALLVNRFFSLLKISHIYDTYNRTYVSHLTGMHLAINRIIEIDGTACLETFSEALFINGTRLKPDFSSWSSFRFAIDFFDSKGIGSLTFQEGITVEELSQFFSVLMETNSSSPDPFKELEEKMIESDISHVSVGRSEKRELENNNHEHENFAERAKRSFYYAISYLKTIASQVPSGQVVNAKKAKRVIQSFVDEIVEDESYMLSLTTIKNYDVYTLNHSINVCILSLALGMRIRLDKSQLCELGVAALFHDLGKVQIPEEIIKKPARLTEEEYEEVKKHSAKGAMMLSKVRGLGAMPVRAMLVALQHHQRLDHQGYPATHHARDLDLFSRIVSMADFFDASTSPRPYKVRCLRRDEALAEIVETRGTRFDPLLARAFVDMLGFIPIGNLVLLDTGELAIVWKTSQSASNALRPKVKIITDGQGNFIEPHIESLTARGGDGKPFARSIVRSLDPQEYNIDVASYL